MEKNTNVSIIDEGVKIDGNISSESDLIVKGHINGVLKTGHTTIAKGGKAFADIISSTVIIGGTFEGSLNVTKELTILSTGKCAGRIVSKNLIIERGAVVNALISQNVENTVKSIEEIK